jgi:myo-inositol-1(or 4)-monophosphatase
MDLQALLGEVIRVAEEAGRVIRTTGAGEVTYKGEVDLVTEADRASEALLVERLGALLPGAGILAEEGSGHDPGAALRWVVDPLDGTTNFAHGYPFYSVSVALEDPDGVALGVVHDPVRGETFAARRGGGAHAGERRLQVTGRGLDQALLITGFPYDVRESSRDNLAAFSAFAKRARGLRRGGSAALDLAYLAAGRLDGFWEEKLAPWDLAAGTLLVTEAGGVVTGYAGEPLDLEAGHVVAAGPGLHAEMVEVLRAVEASSGLPPLAPRPR